MSEAPPAIETKLPEKRESHQPPWLAIALALIAASAPITTHFYTSASKDKELALAREEQKSTAESDAREQEFKMRTSFLDGAVDPARNAADRQLVLRFLARTTRDAPLREWAESELRGVESELKHASEQIAVLEDEIRKSDENARALREQLSQQSKSGKQANAELQARLEAAERAQRDANDRLDAERRKLAPSDKLTAQERREIQQFRAAGLACGRTRASAT